MDNNEIHCEIRFRHFQGKVANQIRGWILRFDTASTQRTQFLNNVSDTRQPASDIHAGEMLALVCYHSDTYHSVCVNVS